MGEEPVIRTRRRLTTFSPGGRRSAWATSGVAAVTSNESTFDRGRDPEACISSLKDRTWREFFSSLMEETKVPLPLWLWVTPKSQSDFNACRAVMRLIRKRSEISCSEGIGSPGLSTPARICARRCC
jgi:hypothetical protein